MKCEKCASELPGGKVICPQCSFNNALRGLDRTKNQRPTASAAQPEAAPRPVSPVAERVRARYAPEAKLIQFPVTPKAASDAPAKPEPTEPAWREQTKAKVRAHVERRQTDDENAGAMALLPEDPTNQLIVESALKRIRRSTTLPPASNFVPRQNRRGSSGNQALAHDYELEEQDLSAEPSSAPQAEMLTGLEPEGTGSMHSFTGELTQPAAPAFRMTSTETRQATAEPLMARSYTELEAPAPNEAAPLTTEPSALPLESHEQTAHTVFDEQTAAAHDPRKANVWVGKPAPLWLRALAGAVDLEAAALAYLPFFGAFTSLDGPPGWGDIYVMASSLAIVVYLYQLITYSFNGRTFGMAICSLRCVDVAEASAPINFQRRLWQALGGMIGLLCPPLNFLVMHMTSYERGLADALGKTITLRRAQE